MYYHFLLHFIQQFSLLQQYLIILSLSFIILLVFRYWWCIFFLPVTTICASLAIKHLCRSGRPPFKISGYIYNLLFKANRNPDHSSQCYEISIQKECDTYIRTIVARYICVWYYPLVSTDQEFPEDLMIIFNIILNRLNDRLKSLNSYDLTRLLVNLEPVSYTHLKLPTKRIV